MIRGLCSLHVRLVAAAIGGLMPLLVAAPALAQTAVPSHEVGGVAGYGTWDWISLTFRMTAVLVVIWASVVAMRWYVRRMNGEANGGLTHALQIVETRALGPSRALHLVRIGDRAVLIGATPERINALMEIDDPAQLERIFEGGGEPARRVVPGLFAGLATLPSMLSSARNTLRARAEARATDAAEAAFLGGTSPAPRAAARPAGFLTNALTRLGRRMRGTSMARATVSGTSPAFALPASAPQPGIFSGTPAVVPPAVAALHAALEARAVRPVRKEVGSLFDRTLADAQRTQTFADLDTPMFAEPARPAVNGAPALSAAAMRARNGYQAATRLDERMDDEIAREERISELQRAIIAARRNAG